MTTIITEKGRPDRVKRIVETHDGWTITQIRQELVEGTTDEYYWWNIDTKRTPSRPVELGHKGRSWTAR